MSRRMSLRRAIDQMCKTCLYDSVGKGGALAQTSGVIRQTKPKARDGLYQ